MKDKKILIGITAAICLEFIYGFSFLFIKNATSVASPMSVLSWRYMTGFVFMTLGLIFKLFRVSFKGKPVKILVILSVLSPITYFVAEAMGVQLTSVSESGTLISLIPLVTIFLSTLIIKKPPTRFQIAGILITFAGVLTIVFIKGFEAMLNPMGYILLLVAVCAFSLYSVLSSATHEYTSMEKTYVGVVVGAFVFTAAAFVEHSLKGTVSEFIALPFTDRDFLVAILYLGICCSAVAYALVNISIEYLGANRAAAFAGLTTVISVLSGVLLAGDMFSIGQGLATGIVMLGVYTANISPKKSVV